MPALSISGEALLGAMRERLEHLLACEAMIFELYDHPAKPLGNGVPEKPQPARKGEEPLSQWDQDRLKEAIRFVEKYRGTAELREAQKRGLIEEFVEELPRLEKAHDIVSSVAGVLRYRFDDKTIIEDNKVVYSSIRGRLDSLTDFDDSE